MDHHHARHQQRLARSPRIDAPRVETVNQQVRTSMSVPFQRHMLGDGVEAPAVATIAQQVRTSMSVPFATYMKSANGAPTVDTVNQQVRTSMSVPFATYMRTEKAGPGIAAVDQQVRTSMSVPFNPYMLGAHAEELLKRRVMISPVVSVWQYEVKDAAAFVSWLATREILLSEGRLDGDPEIRGVRYGGTYRLASSGNGGSATFQTIWGYTSESAMATMQRLCSDTSVSATIVQLDLIDVVKGIRSFVAAGEKNFREEVLISVAAG